MGFDDLKRAVESEHGGIATRLQSIPVTEIREGKTVWEGVVHIFALAGNPKASKVYAWSSPIEGSDERRYVSVLHRGGIGGPRDAVRAALMEKHKVT